jgi:ribosomal protein S2
MEIPMIRNRMRKELRNEAIPANDTARRTLCLFLRTFQRAMQQTTESANAANMARADMASQGPDTMTRKKVHEPDSSSHNKAARIFALDNRPQFHFLSRGR